MIQNDTAGNNEPKTKGSRRRLRLLMIAMLCFLGWAALTLWDQSGQASAKISQLNKLESELAEMKKWNKSYKQEIIRLNDKEYIEQRARKDLQMTKPGETLFIAPKDDE